MRNLEPPQAGPDDVCPDLDVQAVTNAANAADQIVLVLGENREMSGEAASRVDIGLPGQQQQLIDAVKATGKPFVVVLFNGRPLAIPQVQQTAPAILEAWFPGVQAGNAMFVGDSLSRDMAGARDIGMAHIWLAAEDAPPSRPCCPGDRVIRSLAELRGLLL